MLPLHWQGICWAKYTYMIPGSGPYSHSVEQSCSTLWLGAMCSAKVQTLRHTWCRLYAVGRGPQDAIQPQLCGCTSSPRLSGPYLSAQEWERQLQAPVGQMLTPCRICCSHWVAMDSPAVERERDRQLQWSFPIWPEWKLPPGLTAGSVFNPEQFIPIKHLRQNWVPLGVLMHPSQCPVLQSKIKHPQKPSDVFKGRGGSLFDPCRWLAEALKHGFTRHLLHMSALCMVIVPFYGDIKCLKSGVTCSDGCSKNTLILLHCPFHKLTKTILGQFMWLTPTAWIERTFQNITSQCKMQNRGHLRQAIANTQEEQASEIYYLSSRQKQ